MEFFLDDDGFKKNENRVQGLWSNNMKRKEYKSHRKILLFHGHRGWITRSWIDFNVIFQASIQNAGYSSCAR